MTRVVLNRAGHTPGREHVLHELKALLKRHDLQPRNFHSLRHYFCSSLIRAGVDIETVRVLAGHSDVRITQRYLHSEASDLKSAIAKLNRGGRG
jgi:site-specific recombinase XerD